MMKRIVCFGASLNSGGAEHQLAQLMEMLVDNGYDVTFTTFSDTEDHYRISDRIHRIRFAPYKSSIFKILSMWCFLLNVKTECVIAYSQRLSVLALIPLLIRPKLKIISSERNFTIGKPDRYESILIGKRLYNRATYIVPNNYSQARYLSNRMPSISCKIHTIINYTDINKYTFKELPQNTIPQIGIFCRFDKQKNFHRFVEAIAQLKNITNKDFHIDWYGNHNFKTKDQIAYFEEGISLIRKYNIGKYITIHNPSRDVDTLIPTFDVLCLPSLYEGFSNSISEYICCGRPVLCSNVSDNSIMVHNGVNGFLFDPLDIKDICNAFLSYLNLSCEELEKMSLNSRKIAETLFDKETFIKKYIELIER